MAYRETQIDIDFPVAGVDNESQGFRDNFSAIKDTLVQAKTDIEELQDTRLNKTDPESDLFDNTLSNVNLANSSLEAYTASGTVAASQAINYANGAAQLFQLTGATDPNDPIIFTLSNFPAAGRLGKVRLHFYGDPAEGAQYFTFAYESSHVFHYANGWPAQLSVTGSDEPVVFEFWSIDQGANIFASYLGKFSLESTAPKLINVTETERDSLIPDFSADLSQHATMFGSIVLNTDTYTVQVYKPADSVTTDGNFLVGEKYIITTAGTTDWAVISGVAGSYTTGDIIEAAVVGPGTGTGEAKLIAWEDH